ncbi:uncharacterized protein LOC127870976 isoform X2 [Dreissena polymorpha]|uniref:Uncharacterized protein n=1 Tax=Dreissena polymorpha TaxID=45954 RepID=A0A9D4LCD8_DREPO|nr:uncharacterized protein LOC127870976 isoform X2 [Dreissena polymorpha]KAH3855234.1 hypothetical protein DPMN_097798 [Dreissena polymorpha]
MVATLVKMTHASSDRELQELYFSIYDQREAAGFMLLCNSFKKDHIPLLQSALVSNMVLDCRDELDQFIEGLRTHNVLTLVREEKLCCLLAVGSLQSPLLMKEVCLTSSTVRISTGRLTRKLASCL